MPISMLITCKECLKRSEYEGLAYSAVTEAKERDGWRFDGKAAKYVCRDCYGRKKVSQKKED